MAPVVRRVHDADKFAVVHLDLVDGLASDMAGVRWLAREYRLEPWAAHLLIAFQGKYDVVTVAGTMGLRIPKKYLPPR